MENTQKIIKNAMFSDDTDEDGYQLKLTFYYVFVRNQWSVH